MKPSPQDIQTDLGLVFTAAQLIEKTPNELVAIWNSWKGFVDTWPRNEETSDAAYRMADALRLAGHLHDARKLTAFALEGAYVIKDEARISSIQTLSGALSLSGGDTSAARAEFQEALVAARRAADNVAICRSLLWIAYLEQLSGFLPVAVQHASACLEIADHCGLTSWRAPAVRSLAQSNYLSGRLLTSRSHLMATLGSTAPELPHLERSRLRLELALVESMLETAPQAANPFGEIERELALAGAVRDRAIAFEYEAVYQLNHARLPEAEAAVRKAVQIALDDFPDGDVTSQSYRIWAEIDIRKGDFAAARQHATDALGVARRVGERIELGALERIFGQCDDDDNQHEAARTHLAESIRILSDCGARYELAHSHLAAGRAEAFDRANRLMHLNSALALFQEMQVERLALETEQAIRHLTSPVRTMTDTPETGITVITRNPALKQVLAELDRFKDTPHTILLEGETGAGKDLLAAYAHFTSKRADRPFVEFNAAAVPEALVESELFGHVKGSFTGALRDRDGLLFAAKNGTFFFNEIGEAPLTFQAKLLTVIESRKARPVGANVERTIEARLIFATNRNLQSEVSKGRFRKDLYFRLSTAHLRVPPLRDRIEDIGPLLVAFLQREGLSREQISALQSTAEWSALGAWPWEGNVRELSTFSQRLAVEVLSDARQRPELVLPRLMKRSAHATSESREAFDRCRIESALRKHSGNKRRAASDLGIPESTLRWKINHLGIQLP